MLFEQRQLARDVAAVSAQRPALPEGRVTSGSSRRRLAGLAQVAKKASDARGFSDQSEQTHAAPAVGARLDIDIEGSAEKLGPGSIAATAASSRRRTIVIVIPVAAASSAAAIHEDRPRSASLRVVFREYGLPERIRTDNGTLFASRGAGGIVRLSI